MINDAEKAALAARVDQVAPLRFGKVWHWVPPAGAVFALSGGGGDNGGGTPIPPEPQTGGIIITFTTIGSAFFGGSR